MCEAVKLYQPVIVMDQSRRLELAALYICVIGLHLTITVTHEFHFIPSISEGPCCVTSTT